VACQNTHLISKTFKMSFQRFKHYNSGLELMEKGDIENAIIEYKLAIEENPDNADAHNNLAYAYAIQGKLDQACEEYSKAVQLIPDDQDFHCNLAIALTKKGSFKEAILEYRESS